MKDKEIIEGNKLIASFMKQSWEHERQDGTLVYDDYINKFYEIKYHSSWDWLMPTINKIINNILEPEEGSYDFIEKTDNITNSLPRIDIIYTWTQVVEFIKWYNSQKHD